MKEYTVWARLQIEECDHENGEYRNVYVEDGIIHESYDSEEFLLYSGTDAQKAQDVLNSIAVFPQEYL